MAGRFIKLVVFLMVFIPVAWMTILQHLGYWLFTGGFLSVEAGLMYRLQVWVKKPNHGSSKRKQGRYEFIPLTPEWSDKRPNTSPSTYSRKG